MCIRDRYDWMGFRSAHSGGVNFAFLDGSVRFLADGSSDAFRLAIGTVNGGDIVPGN
jgi:prepilin-type processing-associated H-X9-DG protein